MLRISGFSQQFSTEGAIMFIKYLIFTTKHKEKLNDYAAKVGDKVLSFKQQDPNVYYANTSNQKNPLLTVQSTLRSADSAHTLFSNAIKNTTADKIKSCIPFTAAFKARFQCAKSIDTAYKALNVIVKKNSLLPPVTSTSQSRTRQRSLSDPTGMQPNHHPNLFAPNKKAKDDSFLPNHAYNRTTHEPIPRRNIM